jgi:4-nitrophenyl phosphatase
LVVGDRLDTDIVGAQPLGCQTALVLSGVTSEEAAQKWSPRPDYIAQDLQSLITLITKS